MKDWMSSLIAKIHDEAIKAIERGRVLCWVISHMPHAAFQYLAEWFKAFAFRVIPMTT